MGADSSAVELTSYTRLVLGSNPSPPMRKAKVLSRRLQPEADQPLAEIRLWRRILARPPKSIGYARRFNSSCGRIRKKCVY
jgi:hypothetical protein